jgi:hypothetical protein
MLGRALLMGLEAPGESETDSEENFMNKSSVRYQHLLAIYHPRQDGATLGVDRGSTQESQRKLHEGCCCTLNNC